MVMKNFITNLLKKYFERQKSYPTKVKSSKKLSATVVAQIAEGNESEGEEISFIRYEQTESVENIQFGDDLTAEQTAEVKRLVSRFKDVFTDVPGTSTKGRCELKLTTDEPICSKQYPIPYYTRADVQNELKEMLKMGVVEPTKSRYNSPILLVKKKDGKIRFCIDFRKINACIEKDPGTSNQAKDIFAKVGDAKFLSRLDLSRGYWQIPLAKDSREKTAFQVDGKQYQFTRMPFGITTASFVFTRTMNDVLNGIKGASSYIDDILVHTNSWKDHLETLERVLLRLREAHMTAKPSKCLIATRKAIFLGHRLKEGELEPGDDTLSKIRKAERPTTKKQVRSFLGLAGFYHNYIQDFASKAAPLTELTKKYKPNKVQWTEKEEEAFRTLVDELLKRPILRVPDLSLPFVLRTDASDVGIGAVLLQPHDGILHPVAFASRKLSPAEQRYSAVERECLAIVWAVSKKFKLYLYGKEFIIESDHQPLRALMQNPLTNSRVMRWALALQEYHFKVQHIKGRENSGADYFSRVPVDGHSCEATASAVDVVQEDASEEGGGVTIG